MSDLPAIDYILIGQRLSNELADERFKNYQLENLAQKLKEKCDLLENQLNRKDEDTSDLD